MRWLLVGPSDCYVGRTLMMINKLAGTALTVSDFKQRGRWRVCVLDEGEMLIQTDLASFSRIAVSKLMRPDALEPSFLVTVAAAILAAIAAFRR